MEYFAIALGVLATAATVVNRTMVGKIYDSDRKVMSRFALPRVIRQEYIVRYGKDSLYWSSKLLPTLFAILALFMIAMVLTKTRF
jgi:hypothetical protein